MQTGKQSLKVQINMLRKWWQWDQQKQPRSLQSDGVRKSSVRQNDAAAVRYLYTSTSTLNWIYYIALSRQSLAVSNVIWSYLEGTQQSQYITHNNCWPARQYHDRCISHSDYWTMWHQMSTNPFHYIYSCDYHTL